MKSSEKTFKLTRCKTGLRYPTDRGPIGLPKTHLIKGGEGPIFPLPPRDTLPPAPPHAEDGGTSRRRPHLQPGSRRRKRSRGKGPQIKSEMKLKVKNFLLYRSVLNLGPQTSERVGERTTRAYRHNSLDSRNPRREPDWARAQRPTLHDRVVDEPRGTRTGRTPSHPGTTRRRLPPSLPPVEHEITVTPVTDTTPDPSTVGSGQTEGNKGTLLPGTPWKEGPVTTLGPPGPSTAPTRARTLPSTLGSVAGPRTTQG